MTEVKKAFKSNAEKNKTIGPDLKKINQKRMSDASKVLNRVYGRERKHGK